jgi:hypothetical protein
MFQSQAGSADVLQIVGPGFEVERGVQHPAQGPLQPETEAALRTGSSCVGAHQEITVGCVIPEPQALVVGGIGAGPIEAKRLWAGAVVLLHRVRIRIENVDQTELSNLPVVGNDSRRMSGRIEPEDSVVRDAFGLSGLCQFNYVGDAAVGIAIRLDTRSK